MAIRERRGDGGSEVARWETRRSDDCSDPKAKNKNATKDTKLAKKKANGIATFSSTHTKGRRWLLAADAKRDRTKTECDDDGRREGGVGGSWGDKVVEEGWARRAQAPTGRER